MLKGRMGTPGHLGCFLASLLAAALFSGWRVGLAPILSITLAVVFYPVALHVLRSRMLWVFSAVLLLSGMLWVGTPDTHLGRLVISSAGLATGAQMALRAITILIATRGLAASTSPGELAGLLERAGVRGLGFTLGVAANLLPALEQSSWHTWDTLRMRGGLRRRRRLALRSATLTVMSSALRRADEIAIAAEVRGFGPERARPLPLRQGPVDVPVIVGLLGLVILLAAWR
jgi:energy-coupling factor transporter transmembrane protein EcfT